MARSRPARRPVADRGVLCALGAAALFGASTPFAKLLLGAVSPWVLAAVLYLGSGVGLAAWIALRARPADRAAVAPIPRADWPWLAAAIAAGGVAGPVLLMQGLARTDAASASPCSASAPESPSGWRRG